MTPVPFAEVVGDPVSHSLSPVIHEHWLGRLGMAGAYRRCHVRRGELDSYLSKRRQDPLWRGCNVTMPLKLEALSLADVPGDLAIGTGAANLLFVRDSQIFAGNTDVRGASAPIERLIASGASARLVTVLGTGGAARAALMALHLLGISNVRIQARNLGEAYKLAVQFRLSQEPRPLHTAIEGDGLINATPLGMRNMPPLNVALSGLSRTGWVFDFITDPRRTELMDRAQERGLRVISGIQMLVEQAACSFEYLFDAPPPRDADDALLARLLQ